MRLSNKSTFSLVSLVALIALGLVFGVTSVMAHPHIDVPTTPNIDESDVDHEADDHPMATITLIPANDDAFTEKSVDEDDTGQPVVQLLNSNGEAFAILEDDPDATPNPINQDTTGIFKLLIEFNKDLTPGSSLAISQLTLTALGESGANVTTQLRVGTPERVLYDHDNDNDALTNNIPHPRRFEVTINVDAAQYAELPITVFASVNADAVESAEAVNPNSGETIPELANPKSLPADAKFSIVAELPPPPEGPDTTPPTLMSITAGNAVAAAQAEDGSFKITVVFDLPLHALRLRVLMRYCV